MKKIVAGGFMLISSVLLYFAVHITTVLHVTQLTSWNTELGKYGTALRETGGLIGMIIAVLIGIIGLLLILSEWYGAKLMKIWNKGLISEDTKESNS